MPNICLSTNKRVFSLTTYLSAIAVCKVKSIELKEANIYILYTVFEVEIFLKLKQL